MDISLKELIGFTITIAIAAIGWIQWKRTKRSGRFIEDRESAYNEVWKSLEDAHLFVREEHFDQLVFDSLVTKANTLLIRKALHIADDDRDAAATYIAALNRFGIAMAQASLSSFARRQIAITEQTVPLPPGLLEAYGTVSKTRQAVMERFRRAIGSGQI
jgi:hypothetical protein